MDVRSITGTSSTAASPIDSPRLDDAIASGERLGITFVFPEAHGSFELSALRDPHALACFGVTQQDCLCMLEAAIERNVPGASITLRRSDPAEAYVFDGIDGNVQPNCLVPLGKGNSNALVAGLGPSFGVQGKSLEGLPPTSAFKGALDTCAELFSRLLIFGFFNDPQTHTYDGVVNQALWKEAGEFLAMEGGPEFRKLLEGPPATHPNVVNGRLQELLRQVNPKATAPDIKKAAAIICDRLFTVYGDPSVNDTQLRRWQQLADRAPEQAVRLKAATESLTDEELTHVLALFDSGTSADRERLVQPLLARRSFQQSGVTPDEAFAEKLRGLATLGRTITKDDVLAAIRGERESGWTQEKQLAVLEALVPLSGEPLLLASIDKAAAAALFDVALAPSVDAPSPPRTYTLDDMTVYLRCDGTVQGDAGVPAYTRSYDATKDGPLRQRHGSKAPPTTLLSSGERQALDAMPPGQALDAAAATFGASATGFQKLANAQENFNPFAAGWQGKCHAWAWSSLNATVDQLVDVQGPAGQKGLWIGGQWLSRADLGDWMMALADHISQSEPREIWDINVSALDMLRGSVQFLTDCGGGMIADVWNDRANGTAQVWNQPFVSCKITTRELSGDAAAALLTKAGAGSGAQAKYVSIIGTFAAEAGNGYEGEPARFSQTWNLYTVCDSTGKVLQATLANDGSLGGIANLPSKYSADLPDYIWKPTLQALDDTLAGRPNPVVDNDAHGPEFKFFVSTVLKLGVPATVRSAFEKELDALPAGAIDPATVAELAKRYGNVANAYSPEQWRTAFASRGLDAKAFGAAWVAAPSV
jgi:hypothetical protein